MTKKTKNADRNRPEKTTPSCFAPNVEELLGFSWSSFGCLIDATGYGFMLTYTQIDESTKGGVAQLRGIEGVTHARLAGRDGGVAGRCTNMWLGRTPDKLPIFCFFG
jgi:hypothetical protein